MRGNFVGLEDYKKELYEKKYINTNGERVHVTELEDRSVTPEEHQKMTMNVYATDDMPPKLTDEALLQRAKVYMENIAQKGVPVPCTTYEEVLLHRILPEVLKRLGEKL